MKVVDHVKWRASIGHGLDWHMLGLLLQELFLALKLANPARVTGLEDVGQLPTSIWIHSEGESLCGGEKKRLGGNVHPQNGDIGGCEASCVASEDYTIDQVRTLGRPDHISCWATSP